jgi:jumonji domain-containing protein 7
MTMGQLLDYLEQAGNQSAAAYLEYTALDASFPELKADLPSIPLTDWFTRRHRNIWLSDGHTLGKLHFDPFDNLLTMVSGTKHVHLLAPHNNTQLQEGHLVEAQLTYHPTTRSFSRTDLHDSTAMVMSPLALADLKRRLPVLTCSIHPGDALFMPAFWWHEVQSEPDAHDHRNLAVNEWYEPIWSKEFPCATCPRSFNSHYRDVLSRLTTDP